MMSLINEGHQRCKLTFMTKTNTIKKNYFLLAGFPILYSIKNYALDLKPK